MPSTKQSQSLKILCTLCSNQVQKALMPHCQCNVCQNCVKQYCLAVIKHQDFDVQKSQLACPVCVIRMSASETMTVIGSEKFQELDEEYQKKYYLSRKDLYMCPRKECSYYGFIDNAENSSNKSASQCSEPFTCAKCAHKWIELTVQKNPSFETLGFDNLGSLCTKFLTTKSCPKCDVPIYKISGCNHMTCSHCKHAFCWICKQDWKGHDTNKHEFIILVKYVLPILLTIIIMYMGYKFNVHRYIATASIWVFHFLLAQNILLLFVCYNIMFLIDFIYSYLINNKRQLYQLKKQLIVSGVTSNLGAVWSWVLFRKLGYDFMQTLAYYLTESIIIAGIIIGFKIVKNFHNIRNALKTCDHNIVQMVEDFFKKNKSQPIYQQNQSDQIELVELIDQQSYQIQKATQNVQEESQPQNTSEILDEVNSQILKEAENFQIKINQLNLQLI